MYNYQIVGKLPELYVISAKYMCKDIHEKNGVLIMPNPDTILVFAGFITTNYLPVGLTYQTSFSQN